MIKRLRRWRHARRYPHIGQVIRYKGTLVRVRHTFFNRDDLGVRWYDDQGRHDELVSWSDCELP